MSRSFKLFKLVTSESFVAEILDEDEQFFVVQNPLSYSLMQNGQISPIPYLFVAKEDQQLKLEKKHVILVAEPHDCVVDHYLEVYTNGGFPLKSNNLSA